TSELLARTEEAHKSVLEQSTGAAEKLAAVAESARETMERLREVEPPSQELANRLDKVGASLEALAPPIETITSAVERSAAEIARATHHLALLSGQLDAATRESREQQAATTRHIATAAEQFRQALSAAGDALRQDKEVLAELEA